MVLKKYLAQLGKPWHRTVFLILKYAFCDWSHPAASTPHGGTVGMHSVFSPRPVFHRTFFFQYRNNMYKGQERADKGNWNPFRTFDSFLALGKGPPFLILGIAGFSCSETYDALSSCVSREPSRFVSERQLQAFGPPPSHPARNDCTGNNRAYSRHSQ